MTRTYPKDPSHATSPKSLRHHRHVRASPATLGFGGMLPCCLDLRRPEPHEVVLVKNGSQPRVMSCHTARTYPGSQQVTFEYDENARPFRMVDGTGTTYWHYDERGAVDWREDAFGTTYFVYDGAGRRTAIVNAAGETTYYEYDDANRVTVVTSPFGDATTYQYLNNDLTQSATMGNDVASSYDYDTGNRIRSITHRRLCDSADLGSFTYEYDANSNRTKLSFAGDAVPPFVIRVGRVAAGRDPTRRSRRAGSASGRLAGPRLAHVRNWSSASTIATTPPATGRCACASPPKAGARVPRRTTTPTS